MIKLLLQGLLILEQLLNWMNVRRLSLLKANARQEGTEATAVAKGTKDTTRLDAIFNNKSL